MPAGFNLHTSSEPATAQLLTDATFTRDGKTVSDHQIFETIFLVIERAQKFLILDMFLYNGDIFSSSWLKRAKSSGFAYSGGWW